MTHIPSTVAGRTLPVDIDDAVQAGGRSNLGLALSAISHSGRELEVDLPGTRTIRIPVEVIRTLARDGAGTQHRIGGLAAELQRLGVASADAPGIAARILAGVDQLHTGRLPRATEGDDMVGISLRGDEIRVVPPGGDGVERTRHAPSSRPGTAPRETVPTRVAPEHRHPPLDARARYALDDSARRGLSASIVMGQPAIVYNDAASARGDGARLDITPENMRTLASAENPVHALRELARAAGVRLTPTQARELLPQIGYAHDVMARAIEGCGSAPVTAPLWGFGAAAATNVEVTPEERRALTTASGEARMAVIEQIATRAGVALGEGDDRLITLMSLSADLQEAFLLRASLLRQASPRD